MATNTDSSAYEVIVVGAGIMGSTTAYYLAKHYGQGQVLLLEQFDWLHRRGSSHGESRIIRRMYCQDHYTYLMKDGYNLWADAEREAGTKVFTRTGGVDFGNKGSKSMESIIAAARKHNAPHEILDHAEIAKRFPAMKIPAGEMAVYSPDSGILNATKAVAMFQDLARTNGARLVDNTAVVSIERVVADGGHTAESKYKITTETGTTYYCKKCVLTSGAWTPKIVRKCFGIELPVQPEQTTIAYWNVANPDAYASSRFPIFIYNTDEGDAGTIYGCPAHEFPTMIKCCAHFGIKCDPDNRTFQPCMEPLQNKVHEFIQTHFKDVSQVPTSTETCMYQTTPDSGFILDQLTHDPNIVIGCGFSGHGFKLGPSVGKILSQLSIYGRSPYPDLNKHFVLARFNK